MQCFLQITIENGIKVLLLLITSCKIIEQSLRIILMPFISSILL
ncbi:hypothetical protein [Spiroplasma endosymbiont of Polydrusus pterygomalis]